MTWYEESWELKNTPENMSVTLCGVYNVGVMEPAIVIKAIIQSIDKNDTSIIVTLYTHDPAHREDPSIDEILLKYKRQILRIIENINDYQQLISKLGKK